MLTDLAKRQADPRIGPGLAIVALLGLIIMRSWLCDDAYITLRTVDNLVHGFGARWNIADRVQTYTHPLWMLLLAVAYAITREPYFTTLALGWLFSALAGMILVFRLAATPLAGAWAMLALALCAAFVDYSTSGLENPLTHALLACFLWSTLTRPAVLPATLAASLLILSRPDAIVLVAPALAWSMYSARRTLAWSRVAIGASPLAAWAVFSITYYGFLWPNSAYAKLGSGIAGSELARQGVHYLAESLQHDPLTLVLIASALILSLRASALERALALGVVLYLAWVVKFGGDFMSGRFLSAPLLVAVALIARRNLGSRRAQVAIVCATVLCGALSPRATWRLGSLASAVPPLDAYGIADERSFYLDSTGLAARLRSGPNIAHRARLKALEARAQGTAFIYLQTMGCGIFGFYAGPGIHIVDAWALGDPLLARLPAIRQLHWRIGHFTRIAPPGYLNTLATGHNQIRDANLAKYWQQLALLVRGPLFAPERWQAILGFASGRTDRLIDRERLRLADLITIDAARCDDASGDAVQFGDGGIDLRIAAITGLQRIELVIAGGDQFTLLWYRGAALLASSVIEGQGTLHVQAEVPLAARAGVDRLRILSERGTGAYRLERCHVIAKSVP